MANHVFKFTPAGGEVLNLNDRANTFLCKGFKLGSTQKASRETRNYTGAIRQLNVHEPLVRMFMPIFVHETDGGSGGDLEELVTTIQEAVVLAGVVEFAEPGGTSRYFTTGVGDAPDPEHDLLYIRERIAKLDLWFWRLP
jgi:hypothetical protein